jgi:mono/diheme cytochrome c family protein
VLLRRAPAHDLAEWAKDARLLADAGAAAYKAAQAKDASVLAATAAPLDQSCTACHKQYRPNVFPSLAGGGDRRRHLEVPN